MKIKAKMTAVGKTLRQVELVGVGIPLEYQGNPPDKVLNKSDWATLWGIISGAVSTTKLVFLYNKKHSKAYRALSAAAQASHEHLIITKVAGIKSISALRKDRYQKDAPKIDLSHHLASPTVLGLSSLTDRVLGDSDPRDISWLLRVVASRIRRGVPTLIATSLPRKVVRDLFVENGIGELFDVGIVIKVV